MLVSRLKIQQPCRAGYRSIHAFTRPSLKALSASLDALPTFDPNTAPPHSCGPSSKRPPSESAVLIPLINVGNEPYTMMQLRSASMRVHANEAGFPGGKVDPTDESFVAAALREANEELALDPKRVELLGALPPAYSLGNKSRVWPIVGFVHPSSFDPSSTDSNGILPSQPVSQFIPSPDEVSALLPLPLNTLLDPDRRSRHFFRLNVHRPYWKIRADDLMDPPSSEHLEVWGLSGWFLNVLASRAGWVEMPETEQGED